MKESVICKICGATFKSITNTHLQKHSISLKGYQNKFPETNLNFPCNKGHQLSETIRKKVSKAVKEALWRPDVRKRYLEGLKSRDYSREKHHQKKCSAKTRQLISQRTKEAMKNVPKEKLAYWKGKRGAKKGYSLTKEVKEKVSESVKKAMKNVPREVLVYWKGKTFSREHREKIGLAERGEKHWNWKGGISFEPYPPEFNDNLKEKIRRIDKHVCQICGINKIQLGYKLDIHHIDGNKNNNSFDNLISLCRECHISLEARICA